MSEELGRLMSEGEIFNRVETPIGIALEDIPKGGYGVVKINSIPNYKYTIQPFGSNDVIYRLQKRPGLWKRFWMRVFFGWKFEKIVNDDITGEFY